MENIITTFGTSDVVDILNYDKYLGDIAVNQVAKEHVLDYITIVQSKIK